MCLVSNTLKPKKAKEDIVCYKYLKVVENDGITTYHSPFNTQFKWKVGDEYVAENEKYLRGREISFKRHEISQGYFHTYAKYIDCNCCAGLRDAICMCVIPKGTYYYKGVVNGGVRDGYASKHLKIVKIC